MEIGDRVRLLHGKEEGIIRKFIDPRTVEVEIEDGFQIPVLIRELVQIDKGETENFRRDSQRQSREIAEKQEEYLPAEDEEIYLALELNNTMLDLWLLNNTAHHLLFTAHAYGRNGVRGISYGTLKKLSYSKIDSWNMKEQEDWPELSLDMLPFMEKSKDPAMALSVKLHIKNSLLIKKQKKAPLLEREAVLIGLLASRKAGPVTVDPENLKKSFFEQREQQKPVREQLHPGRRTLVDLHIESLVKDPRGLGSDEILKIQLENFEMNLEKALIDDLEAITFVHGIGNGTLRHRIHKFLSQYPHIRYFEDAQKGKFGYAATKVIFK